MIKAATTAGLKGRIKRHLVFLPVLLALALSSAATYAQDEESTPRNDDETLTARYLLREKGMRALDDRIPAAAERFFRKYREATNQGEPDFADATILLVRALLQEGDVDGAKEAISHHEEETPGVTDSYFSEALRYWRAKIAFAEEEWQAVIGLVEPLIKAESDSEFRPRALELAGGAAVALEQFAQAQGYLQTLMREFPESEAARNARISLIRAHLAEGEAELAAGLLDALEEENADQRRVQLYSVMLALQQDKPEKAYELYSEIKDEVPAAADGDWWLTLSHLTTRLMVAEHYKKALEVASQATEVAPDSEKRAEAQLQRARCMIELEQVELAINALRVFQAEHPNSEAAVSVHFHLGQLLRRTENPLAAADYFKNVLTAETVAPDLRYRAAYQQGWCFKDAGDFRSARDAFSEAARLGQSRQQQAEAFLLAGDAAFQLEDFTKAALSYQAVADNYPKTEFAERARFRQASARMKAELYGNAAVVYKQFLEEFPDSELRQQAWLERGIALKRAGETEEAIDVLVRFAEEFPENDQRATAMIEAALASATLGRADSAVALFGRVIEEGGSSSARAHALYQRARIRFAEARYEDAIRDAWQFLEDYPNLPMAADVHFWLGDHYANQGEPSQGEKYFRELYTNQPNSELAPRALYEAARLRVQQENPDGALELLEELRREFPEAEDDILARVEILHGDILADTGELEEALEHYRAAHSLRPETELGLSALGRAGDMLMALGGADEENDYIEQALEHFSTIASTEKIPPAMREKAVYRKAKAYERLGKMESALAEYQDIVYGYDIDLENGQARDWFYFLRAGVDAARLLTLQDKHRQSARILERLAESGIPIPEEFAAKAQEIRESHNLE